MAGRVCCYLAGLLNPYNPDDAPGNDFSGYDLWLAKINQFIRPRENARNEQVALERVRRAEMVSAFIEPQGWTETVLVRT